MNQTDAVELKPPPPSRQNDTKAKSGRVDTTALNGLRGFFSIYIMVFHTLVLCKWEVDILGNVVMPFFFLISGFVLALNDGKRQYALTKCCSELRTNPPDECHFNAKHFWRRRMARTLPLFYLTNLVVIPVVYAGHHGLVAGSVWNYAAYVLTLFVATTWLGQALYLNGPSWFVSTMWFFYWIFPSLLPKLQRHSAQQKQRWIMVLFWIQLIVGTIIIIIINDTFHGPGFHTATYWPPSRLPVFIMGVFAGLLRNEGHPIWAKQQTWTLQNWKQWSDGLALLFTISFLIVGVVENFRLENGEPISEKIRADVGDIGLGRVWMQLAIAWLALQFIVSLTFDEGISRISKMLTSRVALECGRIGYAVYLVHMPVHQYLQWMIYGALTEPACNEDTDGNECEDQWGEWRNFRLIPIWCVPVVCIVSIILSVMLNRWVEEPMRKMLRPPKESTTELQKQESIGLTAPKVIDV